MNKFLSHTLALSIAMICCHLTSSAQMPTEIEPVKAPFETIQFARPSFPNRTLSIATCGAKQGKLSTAAIQKTIDKVAKQGGGKVVVPAGKWLSGRIMLKSNVNLVIEEDAELHFSGNIKDYLPVVKTRNEGTDILSLGAMIYAHEQTNIAITGKGKLVGPDTSCEMFQRKEGGISPDVEKEPFEKRVFDGAKGAKVFLPVFFGPVECKGVFVEGVTFDRSIFWNIAPTYCDNIIIRGVTVTSHGHSRTDGIDIDSSTNTLVEYTSLDCGDDCFTLKAGRGNDGVDKNRPTDNVVIRHCTVKRGVGGIAIGTETAAMIRKVYAQDITMENAKMPLYFKTRRPRGGGGEDIYIDGMHVKNCSKAVITFDMLGSVAWVGELAKRLPVREINKLTPKFRNIYVKDLTVDSCEMFISAKGLPEQPIEDFTLENVKTPTWKMKVQDMGRMTVK